MLAWKLGVTLYALPSQPSHPFVEFSVGCSAPCITPGCLPAVVSRLLPGALAACQLFFALLVSVIANCLCVCWSCLSLLAISCAYSILKPGCVLLLQCFWWCFLFVQVSVLLRMTGAYLIRMLFSLLWLVAGLIGGGGRGGAYPIRYLHEFFWCVGRWSCSWRVDYRHQSYLSSRIFLLRIRQQTNGGHY